MNKGILQHALSGRVDLQLDYRATSLSASEMDPPLTPFAECADKEHPFIQQLVSMYVES